MLRQAIWIAVAGGTIGLCAWAIVPPASPVVADWSGAYDVTAREPELIPSGTVIDPSGIPGWSNIVVKSLPRIRPDHRNRVNALTARMATWMFTAFVADVQPETTAAGSRNRIRAVALGLGTSVNNRDTIVTAETAEKFGIKLDWITRQILTKGYERQSGARVVVHGPTFALLDTPVWFVCGDKHQLVRFRYGLLADGPSGPLDVLVWLIGPEGGMLAAHPEVVWLNPNTVQEAELLVSSSSPFEIPTEATFAVDQLPPGRAKKNMPSDLRTLADQNRFSPDEAHNLESGLRRLLTDG